MRLMKGVFGLLLVFAIEACSGGGGAPPMQPSNVLGSGALPGPTTNTTGGSTIPKLYTLTDLGTEVARSPGLVPSALNNNGVVVGEASVGILGSLPSCTACGPPVGWVFKNGTTQPLPVPTPGAVTFADDINNAGVIAGGYATATTEFASLWNPDGTVVNLGTGIAPTHTAAEATVIANNGTIGGLSYDFTTGGSNVPTFFDGTGGATNPCGSSIQGYFRDINDKGVGVGDEILSAGGTAAMTCPPFAAVETPSDPSFLNFGFDINNAGDVVGRLTLSTKIIFHPFLFHNGTTTDLGTLFPNEPSSIGAAFGINNSGVIVGWTAESGGIIGPPPVAPTNPRAFIYANGKMVDLNTLLPSSCAQWRLVVAEKINDRGQIIGAAFVGGYPNGVEHAFLLTPK